MENLSSYKSVFNESSIIADMINGGNIIADTLSLNEIATDAIDGYTNANSLSLLGSTITNVKTALLAAMDQSVATTTTPTFVNAIITNPSFNIGNELTNSSNYRNLLTTKGDLMTYSTLAIRLPISTNNYVLMCDSTSASGNKWGQIIDASIATGALISTLKSDNKLLRIYCNDSSNGSSGFGYLAGTNVTGISNLSMGNGANQLLTTGVQNVAIGGMSLVYNIAGGGNTCIGYYAGNKQVGSRLTAIGYYALNACVATTNSNVGIGYFSGVALTTGLSNTFIGYRSGVTILSGSNNIMIGNAADALAAGANIINFSNGYQELTSNTINIGLASHTTFRACGISFTNTCLDYLNDINQQLTTTSSPAFTDITATTANLTTNNTTTLNLAGNILPTIDVTSNLGAALFRFSTAYINSIQCTYLAVGTISAMVDDIHFDNHIIPDTSNTYNLGSTAKVLANIYSNIINCSNITSWNASIISDKKILPTTDNNLNLGSAGYRWNSLYLTNLYLDELTSTLSSINFYKDIFPNADGTLDIGKSTQRVAEIHVKDIYNNGINQTELAGPPMTPTAGYSVIWTKNTTPNSLYFNDDNNTSHLIKCDSARGNASFDGSATQIPLYGGYDTSFTTAFVLSGNNLLTKFDGATRNILSVQTHADGIQVNLNSGIAIYAGDIVILHNTIYDGEYLIITVVSATAFTVNASFLLDDVGLIVYPSQLKVGLVPTISNLYYNLFCSLVFQAVSGAPIIIYELKKNISTIAGSRMRAAGSSTYNNMMLQGVTTLISSDRIWISLNSDTSSINALITDLSLTISSLN